jgi:MoaA/NifB/PqqE/SkfB family radical SAM enzyme
MKIADAVKTGPRALLALLTGKPVPLIVGWYLTYRCNRSCDFCGLESAVGPELDTKQVLKVLDRLASAGTRVIVFSGGEPLMRKDLPEILARGKSLGIKSGLTSNGTMIPDRIDEIAGNLDHVKLSFEGPKEVHDQIRGEGSYKEVMDAAEALLSRGVSLLLNTTLTGRNIGHVEEILDTARRLGVRVKFQPVSSAHTMGKDIQALMPSPEEMRRAISELRLLRRTSPTIANSDAGLEYMENWPHARPMKCYGSRLFLRLDPAGRSFFCTMQRDNFASATILEQGVQQTMASLIQAPCSGCWCTSTLELNLFLEKGWKRPWQILRFFRK